MVDSGFLHSGSNPLVANIVKIVEHLRVYQQLLLCSIQTKILCRVLQHKSQNHDIEDIKPRFLATGP